MSNSMDMASRANHSLEEIKTVSISPLSGARFPQIGHSRYFKRIVSAMTMIIEVFAEAQEHARAAHKRLPFSDW